jgi:hypothetical protein
LEVTKEQLKQKFQEEITPLDIVSGVIYFFGKNASFPTNYKKLHSAFFAEKNNELFREFKFRENGPYPYSELLESVFSRIAIAGLLGCRNPDYRSYIVTSTQLKRIEKTSLKKFSETQCRELKAASQRIKMKLNSR